MMKISLILAHPDPWSFNHAIASSAAKRLAENGHDIMFHDLYAEDFNPIIAAGEIPSDAEIPADISAHCNEISKADGIIIVHPNWWGQPPAILKGWIDRVIRPNVAYRFIEGDSGEGVPEGLLKAKAAIVFNTANTPPERELEAFGDPLELIWRNCIFGLCGVTEFHREVFTVVVTSTPEQRQLWLNKVEQMIDRFFPDKMR
jgi:putative NADPH-quinone reductase